MQLRVMSENDVQRIHDATLTVLERSGIWILDMTEEVRQILQKHGCTIEQDRVRFPRKLVEECLRQLPSRDEPGFYFHKRGLKQGESRLYLIGNAYYIYDYEKGAYRDCEESDIENKLLILDSTRHFEGDWCNLVCHSERHGGGTPITFAKPQDALNFVRRWSERRAGRDYPRKSALNLSSEQRRLARLAQMLIQPQAEAGKVLAVMGEARGIFLNPLSPLQLKAWDAQTIVEVAKSKERHRWVMPCPEVMFGLTGPVTLAGSLVQHNAEVLAVGCLAQMAGPGAMVIYGCVSAAADLRTGAVSHGNFETALFDAAAVQMADHYGMPTRIAPGNTSAREPGVRAAVETAIGLYMGIAAGGNIITTGLLDSTLMISYEHLMLLDEIVTLIKQTTGGLGIDAESLALEVIDQEGRPSSNYVSSEHTVRNMKRDIYYSDFVGRIEESYRDWYEKAHARVKEVLSAKCPDPQLQKDLEAKLAAVGARLKEDDTTWRTGEGEWWKFYVQDLC